MPSEKWDAIRAFVDKVIVPAGAVIVVFVAFFGGITYIIKSEVSDIRADVGGLKESAKALGDESIRTGQRIDGLLKDALERAFPKLTPTATKSELKESFGRANEILHLAKAENIKLSPEVLADYGRQVTALSNDPHMAAVALKTVENLLEYRSFLNITLAPKPGDLVDAEGFKIGQREDFSVEVDAMRLPGNQNGQRLGWISSGKIVRSNSPEAAMFLKIGNEGKTNASAENIYMEGTGFALDLDGYHIKNTVIHGAKIIYNGGPLIMENVYFVNCTFEIRQAQHTQDFTNAVMSHTPASFSIS